MNNSKAVKKAIVTGAASGIGEAVSDELRSCGFHVTSLDVNPPAHTVDQHISMDLADPASVHSAADQLTGTYQILVNAAGIPGTHPDRSVFAVNFLGYRFLTDIVTRKMQPGSAVVNVASVAGFRWQSHLDPLKELMVTETFDDGLAWFDSNPVEVSAYALSKEAMIVHTLTTALRYPQSGVRVNAVLPGPVETPLLPAFERSMGKARIDETKQIVGRHGRPEEIAHTIAFLATDKASWVNGQLLGVDGGVSAGWAIGSHATPPRNVQLHSATAE